MKKTETSLAQHRQHCETLQESFFGRQSLIIVANRGPVTFKEEDGEVQSHRGTGGLVTALLGLCRQSHTTWIAAARTENDTAWESGAVPLPGCGDIQVRFLSIDPQAFTGYYNVIANPLLWFLQHRLWDIPRSPIITRRTWEAWKNGYVAVNRQFGEAIVKQIRTHNNPALVMFQDYQLYLAPRVVRNRLPPRRRPLLMHFIHIPWPDAGYWRILPPSMRFEILDGLCANDLLGFQTREDSQNFLRTCEAELPHAAVNMRDRRIWYRRHVTHVRDFPISVDVEAIREQAQTAEVIDFRKEINRMTGDTALLLRIDRIEPSKNIYRGFLAYEDLLDTFPEHRGKVKFIALLVPSRLDVNEYQNYLNELMGVVGQINARFGQSDWEPVRVLIGESYPRALAALQDYDILLVNSIADGMNLVAKEGAVLNHKNGVLILSESAGAREQLESGALVIPPCDIAATADAIHQALIMETEERQRRAEWLAQQVEREDIADWICRQIETLVQLNLEQRP